jgi:hypothetical protein
VETARCLAPRAAADIKRAADCARGSAAAAVATRLVLAAAEHGWHEYEHGGFQQK